MTDIREQEDFQFTNFSQQGTGSAEIDASLVKQVNTINTALDGEVSADRAQQTLMELQTSINPGAFALPTLNRYQEAHAQEVVDRFTEAPVAAQEIQNKAVDLSKVDGLQRAYVEAISLAEDDITKRLISREFMYNDLLQMQRDTTGAEMFVNFIGEFLPDEVKDASDFLGGDWTDAIGDMQAMIYWFQSKTPEEQVALFPALRELALEATEGNELKAASLLGGLLNLEDNRVGYGSYIFDALDATVAAPLIKGASTILQRAKSAANLVRTSKDANNVTIGGKVNARAMTTPEGELAAGIDKHTAQVNASSFSWQDNPLIRNTTDGVAAASVKSLEGRLKSSTSTVALSTDTVKTVELAEFTVPDLKNINLTARERVVASFSPGGEVVSRQTKVESLLSEIDTTGATIAGEVEREALKAKYIDEWAENVGKIEQERNISIVAEPKFVRDEVDGITIAVTDHNDEVTEVLVKFDAEDINAWKTFDQKGVGFLNSPDVLLRNLENSVEKSTLLGRQEARNLSIAGKAFREATKGVKKKGRNRLNSVLLHGDEVERSFSKHELMYEGVTTPDGIVKLSSVEADSYQAVRRVFDFLYESKNQQLLRQFKFEGFGFNRLSHPTIKFNQEGVYLKPVQKRLDKLPQTVYSLEDGALINKESQMYKLKFEDPTYKFVRFRRPVRMEMPDGSVQYARHGVLKEADIGALPERVLNKHTGYVPKIYEDTYFVARTRQSAIVDGMPSSEGVWRTEGFFGGAKEGEKWKAKFLSENPNVHPDDIAITRDRHLPEEARTDNSLMSFGTLFGGSRTQRKLFHGINEGATSRVNAFQALERNLTHIASSGTMTEFRLGLIEKFKKSAGPYLEDPTNWRSGVRDSVEPKTAAFINRTRDWMNKQLRYPTERERVWEATMTRMADLAGSSLFADLKIPGTQLFSKGGKTLEQLSLDLASTDPAGMLKAATFHGLLGAFSPAQLLVQSQNFIIAASLAPHKIPVLMPRYMALRMAMLNKNNEKFVRHLASAALMNEDDWLRLVHRYDQTGFHQSVKMTADTSAAAEGFALEATSINRAMGMAGRGLDKTLLPYVEGERFGRGYSWLLAESEWRAANKGKLASELADKDIAKRALALTMNMDRANAAVWQDGLLGVATQFKQVSVKFAESLAGLNRNLTPTERIKVVTGQFLAYGTAGIGFNTDWIEQQYAASRGIDLGDASQEELAAIHGGVMEFLFEYLFDVRVSSDRFSMIRGISDMMEQLMDDDTSFVEAMAGPFHTMPSRLFESVNKIATLHGSPKDIALNPESSLNVLSIMGEVFSSWRNVKAAQEWEKLGQAVDKNGNPLFAITEENKNAIWLKAMGLTPLQQQDIYRMEDFNKSKAADIKELQDGLATLAQAYAAERLTDDEFSVAYGRLIDRTDLPAAAVRKAIDNYRKNLRKVGTREERAWKKLLENSIMFDETLPTLELEGARRE